MGPFATASRRTPWFYIAIHQVSLLSHAACALMSTTKSTTTTRDRGDRYGPIEWAQSPSVAYCDYKNAVIVVYTGQYCCLAQAINKTTQCVATQRVTNFSRSVVIDLLESAYACNKTEIKHRNNSKR